MRLPPAGFNLNALERDIVNAYKTGKLQDYIGERYLVIKNNKIFMKDDYLHGRYTIDLVKMELTYYVGCGVNVRKGLNVIFFKPLMHVANNLVTLAKTKKD